MTLLLPALSKVREKGKSITCVGNLRQIGTALTAYGDDNNQFIPPYDAYTDWEPHNAKWQDFIIEYIYPSVTATITANSFKKDGVPIGVFLCPSQTDPANHQSYGMNRYWTLEAFYRTIKQIRNPSGRMAVMDSNKAFNLNPSVAAQIDLSDIGFRHTGCACTLYWDMHVMPEKMSVVPVPAWNSYFWGCNLNY
jgi:hypothetical protein